MTSMNVKPIRDDMLMAGADGHFPSFYHAYQHFDRLVSYTDSPKQSEGGKGEKEGGR